MSNSNSGMNKRHTSLQVKIMEKMETSGSPSHWTSINCCKLLRLERLWPRLDAGS